MNIPTNRRKMLPRIPALTARKLTAALQVILSAALALCYTACQRSLTDIVKEVEPSTFIIYTYDEYGSPNGTGSGFFIAADGTGVTNYHVLDESVKAVIRLTDGTEYEIKNVRASDRDWDIAVFNINNPDNKTFKPLKFATSPIEKGEKVYNISNPLGLESSLSEGIVSSFREDRRHGATVQVTAPISPGSSGSAILNSKGEAFAVATYIRRGGQNLNFGVIVDKDKLTALKTNDFPKDNSKFNADDNFIILNLTADKGSDISLHAIDFGNHTTTLYMSYTHLDLIASENYSREYALASLRQDNLGDAESILSECIENNPNDVLSLNTLGIIAYNVDNNYNALHYFSQAIDVNPNDELGYINRFAVYKYQERYDEALADINQAIILDADQPDYIGYRAGLFMDMKEWAKAKADWDAIAETDDFKNDAGLFACRAVTNAYLENFLQACKDAQKAYELTDDKETEKTMLDLWNKCNCDRFTAPQQTTRPRSRRR